MAEHSDRVSSSTDSNNEPTIPRLSEYRNLDSIEPQNEMFGRDRDLSWQRTSSLESVALDPSSRRDRLAFSRLLTAVVVVLILLFAAGTAYGLRQVNDRDTKIANQKSTINSLSLTNTDLQTQVTGLVTERDNFASQSSALKTQLDTVTADRDDLSTQRDTLAKQTDDLKAQVADLQKKVTDTQASLGDTSRQLSQAQSEQSRQQTRANNAEQLSSALADVISLDDQIHQQYLIFLDRLDAVNKAARANDYYAYSQAYDLAMRTANTLDSLFAQRNAALAKLQ